MIKFIDEHIDTGEMILQEEVNILPDETAGELHDKLMHLGSDLVIKTVGLIKKGSVKTIPQPKNAEIKTAYKLNKDNCKIGFNGKKPTEAEKKEHKLSCERAKLYRNYYTYL